MENNNTEIVGIVAYCDGGASPNPGPCGSGVHLYRYHYPKGDEKPTKFGRYIVTDKGYVVQKELVKQKPVVMEEIIELSLPLGVGTNNYGELQAVVTLFEHDWLDTANKLLVISDSELTVKGVNERLRGWESNNWQTQQGTTVKNLEGWKKLAGYLRAFKERAKFNMEHVIGHNDDFGNTRADWLASLAVDNSAKMELGETERRFEPKVYLKAEFDLHGFLTLNRIYFNNCSDFNSAGVYYQTDGSEDKFITGKRTCEAVYSVIKLKNPEPLIEDVIASASHANADANTILYARMDRLRDSDISFYHQHYGAGVFIPSNRTVSVNFLDKKPMAMAVKPGELQLRTIDILTHVEEILDLYTENTPGSDFATQGNTLYKFIDLTDLFYESSTKKVKGAEVEIYTLKKEYEVGFTDLVTTQSIMIEGQVREVKFNIRLGTDLPSRNALKRLECLNPIVSLVVWPESHSAIRYAFLMTTDEAVGIWSNYHANLVITGLRESL